MATPLYWKSWDIANIFYDTVLRYPMVIKMDTEKQKFIRETKIRRLVPIGISFLSIIILCFTFIAVILKVLIFESTIISRPMVVCYLIITVGLLVIISTAIGCIPCLDTILCQYYSSMLKFDEQICTGHSKTPGLTYIKLLAKEILKMQKGLPYDNTGFMVNGLVIIEIFGGIFLPPFLILEGLDPPNKLFCAYFPEQKDNTFVTIPFLIFRMIWGYWCTLELARVYTTFMIPLMTIFSLYFSVLGSLGKQSLSNISILYHQQLHCINQIGLNIVRKFAGAIMSVATFSLVLSNWVIISGWNSFPLMIYILVGLFATEVYFVAFESITQAGRTNELSKNIICQWKDEVDSKRFSKPYWKRVAKAQRPVSIYYAFTKFEKETKVNYFTNVIDHSVDAMLLY